MEWLTYLLANYQAILSAVVGLLTAAIAVALLVPGEQPEKMLQSWVDFLSKFSRK
jgi:hypothetical protein